MTAQAHSCYLPVSPEMITQDCLFLSEASLSELPTLSTESVGCHKKNAALASYTPGCESQLHHRVSYNLGQVTSLL